LFETDCMKTLFYILFFLTIFACTSEKNSSIYRSNFTAEEQKTLQEAHKIIASAYYTTLITLDKNKQPRARIVEPFLPKQDFVIWMATNPKSRKVAQLKENSTTTLHYFDKSSLAYVSLMGKAFLVNDKTTKEEIWKDGWERFYPDKEKDYLLIKFIPKNLELISITGGFTGDKKTWKPHQVVLRTIKN